MKNIFESEQTFTAYATIEAGMYMLAQLLVRLKEESGKLSPISRMVDAATGYDKVRHRAAYEELVPILEDVIAAKKVIDADYSEDEKMLEEALTMITAMS